MSGSIVAKRPSGWFGRWLALNAFFALVLRVMYIIIASGQVGGDGRYYHAIAALVADGKGFIDPKP